MPTDKSVARTEYTHDYYMSCCGGWDIYTEFDGTRLPKRLQVGLDYMPVAKSDVVLDLGCGRGELSVYLGRQAKRVIGIDYSEAALAISRQTLRTCLSSEEATRVTFSQMNVVALGCPSAYFDKVFIVDLIEHLTPREVDEVLAEVTRVLKPDGLILIHTMPNRLFYEIAYPLIRAFSPLLSKMRFYRNLVDTNPYWKEYGGLPKQPRSVYEQRMHPNEFTFFSIRRVCKKHKLKSKIRMVFTTRDYHERFLSRLISRVLPYLIPFNYIFCVDIIALIHK